jgi:hypothetical protein
MFQLTYDHYLPASNMTSTENKRSCYNTSGFNQVLWTRKKKFGGFKKRKKKYRKSVINKGMNLVNTDYLHHPNIPESSQAFSSTNYFVDHAS